MDCLNELTVRVDNSFNPDMLPRNNSYDWAQDGGITRPVSLLVSPKNYIERLWIDAVPGSRIGAYPLTIHAVVRNAGQNAAQLGFQYRIEEAETGYPCVVWRRAQAKPAWSRVRPKRLP